MEGRDNKGEGGGGGGYDKLTPTESRDNIFFLSILCTGSEIVIPRKQKKV